MESLEEVMKRYKLSKEEHDKLQENIFRLYFFDKNPVKNPRAIISEATSIQPRLFPILTDALTTLSFPKNT